MKKIAIPVNGENISAHFGHAPAFNLYTVDNEEIKNEEEIENPGHQPGLLPKLLNEAGADLVISSGMGQKAIAIFAKNNIDVICGAKGNARKAVEEFLHGELAKSDNNCSHGEEGHHHNGSAHHH